MTEKTQKNLLEAGLAEVVAAGVKLEVTGANRTADSKAKQGGAYTLKPRTTRWQKIVAGTKEGLGNAQQWLTRHVQKSAPKKMRPKKKTFQTTALTEFFDSIANGVVYHADDKSSNLSIEKRTALYLIWQLWASDDVGIFKHHLNRKAQKYVTENLQALYEAHCLEPASQSPEGSARDIQSDIRAQVALIKHEEALKQIGQALEDSRSAQQKRARKFALVLIAFFIFAGAITSFAGTISLFGALSPGAITLAIVAFLFSATFDWYLCRATIRNTAEELSDGFWTGRFWEYLNTKETTPRFQQLSAKSKVTIQVFSIAAGLTLGGITAGFLSKIPAIIGLSTFASTGVYGIAIFLGIFVAACLTFLIARSMKNLAAMIEMNGGIIPLFKDLYKTHLSTKTTAEKAVTITLSTIFIVLIVVGVTATLGTGSALLSHLIQHIHGITAGIATTASLAIAAIALPGQLALGIFAGGICASSLIKWWNKPKSRRSKRKNSSATANPNHADQPQAEAVAAISLLTMLYSGVNLLIYYVSCTGNALIEGVTFVPEIIKAIGHGLANFAGVAVVAYTFATSAVDGAEQKTKEEETLEFKVRNQAAAAVKKATNSASLLDQGAQPDQAATSRDNETAPTSYEEQAANGARLGDDGLLTFGVQLASKADVTTMNSRKAASSETSSVDSEVSNLSEASESSTAAIQHPAAPQHRANSVAEGGAAPSEGIAPQEGTRGFSLFGRKLSFSKPIFRAPSFGSGPGLFGRRNQAASTAPDSIHSSEQPPAAVPCQ